MTRTHPLLAALIVLVAALITGCDRQQAAWEEAQEAGTMAAYQEFLETYPESPNAEQARARIDEMRRTQLWEEARQADSAAAYEAFLTEFPQSAEAEQARARLSELERTRQWEALQDSQDVQALRAFAEQHSGTPVAEQARQRASELEASAREAEAREQARLEEERRRAEEATYTHRVQLAAFQTDARARQGARNLEQSLAAALGETGIEVQRSGRFYLVRTEPMPEDEARSLCDRLKTQGQDCLVVGR